MAHDRIPESYRYAADVNHLLLNSVTEKGVRTVADHGRLRERSTIRV